MSRTALEQHIDKTANEIMDKLKENRTVLCVRPTGYGKTIVMSKVSDLTKGNKLIVVPQTTLIEYMEGFFQEDRVIRIDTYQKLITFETVGEVRKYFGNLDVIFLDEAHRSVADRWGQGVKLLMDAFPHAKVVGLTATPIRTDGKDISEVGFESQVEPLSLVDSIELGFIQAPYYVSALYSIDYEVSVREKKIRESNRVTEDERVRLLNRLNKIKFDLSKLNNIPSIIQKHIVNSGYDNTNMKFIVFCPSIDSVTETTEQMFDWFKESFPTKTINTFKVHSEMQTKDIRDNVEGFKEVRGSEDIDLIFSVNMFNEGLHLDNLTGAIMLRKTQSHIIYFQQLGRVLSSGSDQKPLVFDLVNAYRHVNTGYVQELQERLGERDSESKETKYLKDALIDVYDEVRDSVDVLEEMVEGIENRAIWEDWEDSIIKEFYLEKGAQGVVEKGVNRSLPAIRSRARTLGLAESKWTIEEKDFLKQNYKTKTVQELVDGLKGRSRQSVYSMLGNLGLSNADIWTEEEDNILKEFYRKVSWVELENKLPKRTRTAIVSRASVLQIGNKRIKWTAEEDSLIKEYYLTESIENLIKKMPHRTEQTIRGRASKLGVRIKPNWTEVEDSILIDAYQRGGIREAKEYLPNRTKSSIDRRVHLLRNLKRMPDRLD